MIRRLTDTIILFRNNLGACIALLTIVIALIGLFVVPPNSVSDVIIRVIYILSIISLIKYERCASWLVLMVASINEVFPFLSRCDESWGVILVLSVLGYRHWVMDVIISLLVICACAIYNWIAYQNLGDFPSFYGMIDYILFLFLIPVMAYRIRSNYEKRKLDAIEKDSAELSKRISFAVRIHDGVSSNITRISLLAESDADSCIDNYTSMNMIKKSAEDAHRELCDVVESLVYNKYYNPLNNSLQVVKYINELCTEYDSKMLDNGLRGETEIIGDNNPLAADDHVSLFCSLLVEVYRNMLKYADRSKRYHCYVIISNDHLVLRTSNSYRRDNLILRKKGLGFGLLLYKEKIRENGGILRYGLDEETWELYACVPC